MAVTVKELRYDTKRVIQNVSKGIKQIVTHRGKSVAEIIPLSSKRKENFSDIAFGLWENHSDLKDVAKWLAVQRKPRFSR